MSMEQMAKQIVKEIMKSKIDRTSGHGASVMRRTPGLVLVALISVSVWSSAVVADDELYAVPRDNEVYFTFGSAEIPESFDAVLANHGRRLAANPDISVRIEGHADRRGAREYNLQLGEHRAQAVRGVLIHHGASPEQFATVSFGEEFRVDTSEQSKNRRVVLHYDRLTARP